MSDDSPTALALLPCPECGRETDSLKKYGLVVSWWAVLALVFFRREDRIGCPACIRRHLFRRSLFIMPTNFLLSIVLLTAVKEALTPLHIALANLWVMCVFV